jgi:hypothetical protein
VDVVEVEVAAVVAACGPAGAREAAAECEAEAVALAADIVVVLDAHLQCPAHPNVHRPSIGQRRADPARGQATVTCRRRAVGPAQAPAIAPVAVKPEVVPVAPVGPVRVVGRAWVRAQAVDRWPVVVDFLQIAICKTSSTFRPAALDLRLDPAVQAEVSAVARWLVVR